MKDILKGIVFTFTSPVSNSKLSPISEYILFMQYSTMYIKINYFEKDSSSLAMKMFGPFS